MGRETGSLLLLAPLLLTGGKGADLVIRGNVVLNNLRAQPNLTKARSMGRDVEEPSSGFSTEDWAHALSSLTFDPSSPSSCLMGFPVIFFAIHGVGGAFTCGGAPLGS
jgi:hypothetical protein